MPATNIQNYQYKTSQFYQIVGLNGPILESFTAHHCYRKGWIVGSSTSEVKTVSSVDAFYSVADEYLFQIC